MTETEVILGPVLQVFYKIIPTFYKNDSYETEFSLIQSFLMPLTLKNQRLTVLSRPLTTEFFIEFNKSIIKFSTATRSKIGRAHQILWSPCLVNNFAFFL
ncbi:hypothetical protein [Levilactobacillus tongjiangensis]|uniref:Uncharacterized protein n=1 Tax=Levilactobacillus tongjiangensis TaxID=2486023 RepID=A0ABW1SSP4_9LACO|nr:hypothetical protein [Levilactobacillus tongjiangensis]